MNLFTLVFASLTVLVHLFVFFIESFFWLNPLIYERALSKIPVPENIPLLEQAKILEVLFYNQGFYNLFLALGGMAGIVLVRKGSMAAGRALVTYVCLFAFGAGLVLASSSTAYPGAVIQSFPPFLALIGLFFFSNNHAGATEND